MLGAPLTKDEHVTRNREPLTEIVQAPLTPEAQADVDPTGERELFGYVIHVPPLSFDI